MSGAFIHTARSNSRPARVVQIHTVKSTSQNFPQQQQHRQHRRLFCLISGCSASMMEGCRRSVTAVPPGPPPGSPPLKTAPLKPVAWALAICPGSDMPVAHSGGDDATNNLPFSANRFQSPTHNRFGRRQEEVQCDSNSDDEGQGGRQHALALFLCCMGLRFSRERASGSFDSSAPYYALCGGRAAAAARA